jgi:hypothetical protein
MDRADPAQKMSLRPVKIPRLRQPRVIPMRISPPILAFL